MLASLFKPSITLDENSQQWILDTFAWALEQFDVEVFKNNTQLILPNNDFYPGKVSSVEEMADSIFQHTKGYAGMQKWPVEILAKSPALPLTIEQMQLGEVTRGDNAELTTPEQNSTLVLGFNPKHVNQPQDFIAAIAQTMASILVSTNRIAPPGGKEYLPQAADLVGCMMGFGVVFANTAYQFKGGCGSCNNASLNRQAALSEAETLYALALFCVLKNENISKVKAQLKPYLRKEFVQSYKVIKASISSIHQPALLAVMQ